MLNQELALYDGTRIFPAYLTMEERKKLYERFGDKHEYMYCLCRTDTKLFYRVSADFRIYPEHQGYAHSPGCVFNPIDRRNSAFAQDPESGETRVFLNFKPNDFSVPTDADVERASAEPGEREKDENKYFPLEKFVRQLNSDTWNERMAAGKGLLSTEYFSKALFGRLKNIVIDGLKGGKPLRDYKLNTDGFQFFYMPFCGYEIKEREGGSSSCSLIVEGEDGKKYSWFVYERTLKIAIKRFVRMFAQDPMQMMRDGQSIIMSGFRYLRTRKNSNTEYKVAGRLCFFAINSNGLIARSSEELNALNNICSLLRWKKDSLKFFLADEWEPFYGYFEKNGDMSKYIITADENNYKGCKVMQCDVVEHAPSQNELKSFLGFGGQNN
jgi:hypothetical protein